MVPCGKKHLNELSKLGIKMKLTLCQLEKNDFDEIVSSFEKIGWNKPKNIYEAYLQEQSDGIRTVILAKDNNKFCGYVTIKWKSDKGYFSN